MTTAELIGKLREAFGPAIQSVTEPIPSKVLVTVAAESIVQVSMVGLAAVGGAVPARHLGTQRRPPGVGAPRDWALGVVRQTGALVQPAFRGAAAERVPLAEVRMVRPKAVVTEVQVLQGRSPVPLCSTPVGVVVA